MVNLCSLHKTITFLGVFVALKLHLAFGLSIGNNFEEVQTWQNVNASAEILTRSKRAVFVKWPASSRLTADFFFNIPLQTPKGLFAPFSIQMKCQMDLPDVIWPRGRATAERWSLLELAKSLFNHFGMDGRSCVLLAICESAEFDVMVDGIIGEFVLMILRFTSMNNGFSQDYLEAREYGELRGSCASKYNTCDYSIFRQWL